MEYVINVKGLTKDYKQVRALEGVDLQIPRGRIVGLLGKNGAGKSTLLKCLLDFLRYEGNIEFFGKSLKKWNYDLHTRVAFIPDVSGLDPRLTVQQTMDYAAGINPSWNPEKAERLFAKSELPREQKVKTLSKGMKTKLYLMLTLAKDVDILLLDEPTLGLDIVFRKEFYDLLLGEFFDESKTVIISTHQVAEVENILQDVVFLDHGKVMLHQSVDKLKNDWSIVEVSSDREKDLMAFNPKATSRSLGKVRGLIEGKIKLPGSTIAVPGVSDIFVAVVNQ